MVQLRSQSPVGITINDSPFTTMARTSTPTISISENGLTFTMNNSKLKLPEIKKVIFQKEHTIVIWEDGEKSVVRAFDEDFDKEKGLAIAIVKRFMSRSEFKKLIENADIQDK